MKRVWEAIAKLPARQKAALAAAAVVIVLTWVAVCAILASYL